jgi:hypothetical protein
MVTMCERSDPAGYGYSVLGVAAQLISSLPGLTRQSMLTSGIGGI